MAAPAPAKERSSFAVTCGLLSRYLRENKDSALQGIDLAAAAVVGGGVGAFQPPTTMNLLSGLEDPKPDTADKDLQLLEESAAGERYAEQLTIFYGGKVVVVDNFPSNQVKALLQMANADGAVDKAGSSSSSVAVPQTLPADLPIARRNSLHRFLEKRKDRITAKAPYQVISSSSAAPSKQANGDNSWLGLGQEAAIKKEI